MSDQDEDRTLDQLQQIQKAQTPRGRLLKVAEVPRLKDEAEALLPLFPDFRHYATTPGHELEDGTIEWQIATLEQRAARWHEHEKTVHLQDREAKRIRKLPRADKRRELWRKLADAIRAERPYLKSKTDIARAVRARLTSSQDDTEREAIASIDTIRKQI